MYYKVVIVEQLRETLVHFLINLVQHLHYNILDMVPLKLPFISCSEKSIENELGEATKVCNSLILHLLRQAGHGHIQKMIKGGVHPGRHLAMSRSMEGHGI